MASHLINQLNSSRRLPTAAAATLTPLLLRRHKTTSAAYVSSRARDPTFEKLMDKYKNLLKVLSIQDLILSNPNPNPNPNSQPQSLSLLFLNRLSQHLRLNRGAASFLRRYPHIFTISPHPSTSLPHCSLTPAASHLAALDSAAASPSAAADRILRLLSMSTSGAVPLRAVFKVWRELGLPEDFAESVISRNPNLFRLIDSPHEKNTHLLKLEIKKPNLVAAVDNWRMRECCEEKPSVDRTEIRFSFKHEYPPGMRLSKTFRAKVKEWQRLPYVGPYDEIRASVNSSRLGRMGSEKRAVGIVHEFLNLTVEKMVEVEKISHFRKCFGIDLNIRDLFLDHPGMFYLSTKGKRHTVFLREAYERGCLIEPNPVYNARRKLLDLVCLERRGMLKGDPKVMAVDGNIEEECEEEESD